MNALVDAGYDFWSVEKEEAGPVYTPIAPMTAFPPLAKDVTQYVFTYSTTDVAVIPTIRARAYRSSDSTYDATSIPVTVSLAGYCTIQDVRDQGYTAVLYPDADVQKAIGDATALIDRVTRQWFEPRFKRVMMDAKKLDQLFLQVPIVAVMRMEIDEVAMEMDEFLIYNRHLTHGIVNPDDRADPRVTWGQARSNLDIRRLYGGGRFEQARKSVMLSGVFGYTEHGPGDYIGETAKGSQVPISYGGPPIPIQKAALRLTIRYFQPLDQGDDISKASRVIEEKTRDQSYKLSTPSEQDGSYGITGDIEVDKILMMYPAPLDCGVV